MNILTASALLELIFRIPLNFRLLWLAFYGVIIPFITLTKITSLIVTQKIDKEFKAIFQEAET